MPKGDHIELDGVIVQTGSGGIFKVDCDGIMVTAVLGGKLKKHRIKVVLGDEVKVAVSPYDATRGFITYRSK